MDPRREPLESEDSLQKVTASISKRKKEERKRRNRRIRRRIYKVMLVLLVLAGIGYADSHDISRIKQIRIHGNQIYTEAQIKDALNLHEGDRMITNLPFILNGKVKNLEGVDSIDSKIYYSQGIMNVHVNEKKAVGYIQNNGTLILFSDGKQLQLEDGQRGAVIGLPRFEGFTDERLNAQLLGVFGDLESEILLTISEVHAEPTKFDETAMRLVMNNNYYVYTGINALPSIKRYASIIDKADSDKRCIILSEYGPTEDTNSATVKPCE